MNKKAVEYCVTFVTKVRFRKCQRPFLISMSFTIDPNQRPSQLALASMSGVKRTLAMPISVIVSDLITKAELMDDISTPKLSKQLRLTLYSNQSESSSTGKVVSQLVFSSHWPIRMVVVPLKDLALKLSSMAPFDSLAKFVGEAVDIRT